MQRARECSVRLLNTPHRYIEVSFEDLYGSVPDKASKLVESRAHGAKMLKETESDERNASARFAIYPIPV